MKEFFKKTLKWGINKCKDEFCHPIDVLLLNFGCCIPLGSDNGAKIFHL